MLQNKAKLATGLEVHKPENPIFFALCKSDVVSHSLLILFQDFSEPIVTSSYPNLRPIPVRNFLGGPDVFRFICALFFRYPFSYKVFTMNHNISSDAIACHDISKFIIIYHSIFIYHNMSSIHWEPLIFQPQKSGHGDRHLQSPNLQNKDKSTSDKVQRVYLILQTKTPLVQNSNGDSMKSLWVTKLKMAQNQKGLALQYWM